MPSEPRCAICRNIHPTSTRSNCLTANSRRTCASLPHAPPQPPPRHPLVPADPKTAGMRPLLQTCRLCCHITGIAVVKAYDRPGWPPTGAGKEKQRAHGASRPSLSRQFHLWLISDTATRHKASNETWLTLDLILRI